MLTEKNQIQHDTIPYAYPVAYALKGSSMSNADLRFLVNRVRAACREKNIPILCEVYDGQWQNFITSSSSGHHLMKLHARNTWNRIAGMSKEKVLEEMYNASAVRTWDMDLLSSNRRLLVNETLDLANISVWKDRGGALFTESRGGTSFNEPVITKFVSVTETTRPDLFPLDAEERETAVVTQIAEEHAYCMKSREGNSGKDDGDEVLTESVMVETLNRNAHAEDVVSNLKNEKKKKMRGLQPGERDLLCLLDKDMVKDILKSEESENNADDSEGELLSNVLLDPRCELLVDIHAHLIYNNEDKWRKKTFSDIYPGLLTSGQKLMSECTVAELKTISGVLEHHTKRRWFNAGVLKSVNINAIVRAFGGTCTVPEESTRKTSNVILFSPEKLYILARDYMKRGTYEKIRLTVALGSVVVPYEHKLWLRKSTVILDAAVPGSETVQLFSYPERDEISGELLFRTFDYTHILTNMRSHILSRGYDFCGKLPFEHLVANSQILSRYMVDYKMDIQNAFAAEKVFGEAVEVYMNDNGFEEAGHFIKIVRMWHEACDKRGIPAEERVRRLLKMYTFLTSGINFTSVPFQYKGRYIKGMTWQTFEAILQNISTRIQLYECAHDRTYNTRAVSTLANESFFSDLVQLEREGKGYPKACNIGRVMGEVVLLNHYKHKCDKNYSLGATKKRKYPVHHALEDKARYNSETVDSHVGMYRDHYFDYPDLHKSNRVRKRDITTGLQSLRSVSSIRTKFYKTDESQILAEVRAGNKPKGFVV